VLCCYYSRQLETDKAKPQTTNVLVFFRTGTPLTNLDLLTLLYLQQPDSIGFSFTDGSSKALLLLHLFAIALRYAAPRYSPLQLCKQNCSSLPLYGPFWPLLALA
jgi:hypothetical protein